MLLDVSQPVTPKTAGFPGDEPFSCGWTCRLEHHQPVNLSWVKTSAHVGTHVDAPYHYLEGAARIGELDLEAFIGPAVVVDAVGRAELDADLLDGLDLSASPRVLFRTEARSDPETFRKEFPLLTDAAIDLMGRAGVRLVGVDAPSMDAADAKKLVIHERLARARILNVENLVLAHAQPGRYELMAAPVRWVDLDGAPLRAVLRR